MTVEYGLCICLDVLFSCQGAESVQGKPEYVISRLTEQIDFIAPVHIYPGEDELEALALNALGSSWSVQNLYCRSSTSAGAYFVGSSFIYEMCFFDFEVQS